jgi:hypothetical protein
VNVSGAELPGLRRSRRQDAGNRSHDKSTGYIPAHRRNNKVHAGVYAAKRQEASRTI